MRNIDKIYIDGAFVNPHGNEIFDLFNPTTGQVIGTVKLADEEDARLAIAAAKRAFPAFSRTSKAERIKMLKDLHDAVFSRVDDLAAATIEEYGAPAMRALWGSRYAAESFLNAAINIVLAPAGVDPHIAVAPAQLLQDLPERPYAGLTLWIVRGHVHQHADPAHLLGLLRARC
jgi:acyl-CoA reductase-like NAD-dependent aldehyde dehydrogenase